MDLRQGVENRKIWFHECHLRRLNFESFRAFRDDFTHASATPFYFGSDGKPLDNLPDWSSKEVGQRNKFEKFFAGKTADWISFKQPIELLGKLAEVRSAYVQALDNINFDQALPPYRKILDDELFHLVSRIELSNRKPWLTEQLFGNETSIATFLKYGLSELVDLNPDIAAELPELAQLPSWLGIRLLRARVQSQPPNIRVSFQNEKQQFYISIQLGYQPAIDIGGYIRSPKAWYWIKACMNSLKDLYLIKENSDMGLTHLVRVLYLYGTLPDHLNLDKMPARARSFQLAREQLLAAAAFDSELTETFRENATHIRDCDFRFSRIAEEIIKQVLLRFKYWLDEPFKAPDQPELQKVRGANGADKDEEKKREMQYWSENHYIMFASAEYLLGQLWPNESFQPGKDFLAQDQKELGKLTGKERCERGKWRVLKWLNNRLVFGWTEWHSGGYYREHFEALLNLVDFSMDEEISRKAKMAMDLLMFDIARFSFRGANGAAGGRVQFKGKRSGWDQAIGDLVEVAFGTRGAFNDANSEVGGFISTTGYDLPEVLLEIGTNPHPEAFVDRTRVSITFEEAAKHGIGYSQTSRQRRSNEQGYSERLNRHSAHIKVVNDGLAKSHFNYGKREDDLVFWWTTSAYFVKQTILDTLELARRWGFSYTKPFSVLTMLFGEDSAPLEVLEDAGLAVGGFAAGSFVGGAFSAAAAGPAGLAGAFLGLKLFGKPASISGISAWVKVLLYGLSAALNYPGVIFAATQLGNPFSTEQVADDLSVMTEGSIRTRGNIYTYRSPGAMLSSTQNFRPGQFNFQNDIVRATLSGALSTFVTAPYIGVRVSDLVGGAVGGLLLGPLGAAGGALATELLVNKDDVADLVDHDDGPGWWTGNWSLPRVVQYQNAAILFYDFHWIQELLGLNDTHLFLPESGLAEFNDNVDPNRDRFDDTDSPIEDIGQFFSNIVSRKDGIWCFGRVPHLDNAQNDQPSEEAYVGIFSESRWDKLDRDSSFYEDQIEAATTKALDDLNSKIDDGLDELEDQPNVGYVGRQVIETVLQRMVNFGLNKDQIHEELHALKSGMIRAHFDQISTLADLYVDRREHHRIWDGGILEDYFKNRDRYAKGNSIWIIQVGSKSEYGSFETFKTKLINTRIKLDLGDMTCSYDIPAGDGSTTTLTASCDDAGSFQVNGEDFPVDLYPRFENKYVRGEMIEWGQRDYTIEHNNKVLTHGLNDFRNPTRFETAPVNASQIRAIAVYMRTEDENLDIFSVVRGTLSIACKKIVTDDILAVGEIAENTDHDVEWLYFDQPVQIAADMGIELTHPPVAETSNGEPHWRMSFRMRALMGDNKLKDCTITLDHSEIAVNTGESEVADYGATKVFRKLQLNFEGRNRSSGFLPFSIRRDVWQDWQLADDLATIKGIQLIAQERIAYFNHSQFIALDEHGTAVIRVVSTCSASNQPWSVVGPESTFRQDTSLLAVEPLPGWVFVLSIDARGLSFISKEPNQDWVGKSWQPLQLLVQKLFSIEPIAVDPQAKLWLDSSEFGSTRILRLYLAAQGHLYSLEWNSAYPGELWTELTAPSGMSTASAVNIALIGGVVFLVDNAGAIWAGVRVNGDFVWQLIGPTSAFQVSPGASLAAVQVDFALRKLFVISSTGEVWSCDFLAQSGQVTWTRIGIGTNFHAKPTSSIRAVCSEFHKIHVGVIDQNGEIWTTWWTPVDAWEKNHNWTPLVRPFDSSLIDIWLTSRIDGEIEVYAQTEDAKLHWTWWS